MNKFKALEEFKQENLALMKVVGDQILDKIHQKRLEFNTIFHDEESDDKDDGEVNSEDVGDVVGVGDSNGEEV